MESDDDAMEPEESDAVETAASDEPEEMDESSARDRLWRVQLTAQVICYSLGALDWLVKLVHDASLIR